MITSMIMHNASFMGIIFIIIQTMLCQVPQETVFMSNSDTATKDKLKRNRIHFKFPTNWATEPSKDPIVGIHAMYVSRSYRMVEFTLQVSLSAQNVTTGNRQCVGTPIMLRITKFFNDATLLKDLIATIVATFDQISFSTTIPNAYKTPYLRCFYDFVPDDKEPQMHRSRFVIDSPYNTLPEAERSDGSYIYFIEFQIRNPSDDAKIILNYNGDDRDDYATPLYTYNVWDRDSVILFSNIAYMSEQSFLGHTRKYTLVVDKYYRLTNSNQGFWIDMYAAVDHKCPVYLPSDGKDDLYIEARLLTNATRVL